MLAAQLYASFLRLAYDFSVNGQACTLQSKAYQPPQWLASLSPDQVGAGRAAGTATTGTRRREDNFCTRADIHFRC